MPKRIKGRTTAIPVHLLKGYRGQSSPQALARRIASPRPPSSLRISYKRNDPLPAPRRPPPPEPVPAIKRATVIPAHLFNHYGGRKLRPASVRLAVIPQSSPPRFFSEWDESSWPPQRAPYFRALDKTPGITLRCITLRYITITTATQYRGLSVEELRVLHHYRTTGQAVPQWLQDALESSQQNVKLLADQQRAEPAQMQDPLPTDIDENDTIAEGGKFSSHECPFTTDSKPVCSTGILAPPFFFHERRYGSFKLKDYEYYATITCAPQHRGISLEELRLLDYYQHSECALPQWLQVVGASSMAQEKDTAPTSLKQEGIELFREVNPNNKDVTLQYQAINASPFYSKASFEELCVDFQAHGLRQPSVFEKNLRKNLADSPLAYRATRMRSWGL